MGKSYYYLFRYLNVNREEFNGRSDIVCSEYNWHYYYSQWYEGLNAAQKLGIEMKRVRVEEVYKTIYVSPSIVIDELVGARTYYSKHPDC